MDSFLVLEPKDATSTLGVIFDFTSSCGSGQTIQTAAVTVAVWAGTDAGAQAMLSGSPVISGVQVMQKVTGGNPGAIYLLKCLATLTDGTTAAMTAYLTVNE